MLVATAERDGIGVTAVRAETEPVTGHAAVREPKRGLLGHAAGRRIRARGAIVIGVAAGAMAVSGISAASENATPGDALYGVKRSTERAQLAMAGSDVTRGQLALDFARNRLAEATALVGGSGFAGVLDDMDADTRQGVRLLTTSAVDRKDNTPLDTVDRFVTKQRIVLTPAIEKLSPANQKRAADSLALLDKVEERAEDLTARLACDPIGRTRRRRARAQAGRLHGRHRRLRRHRAAGRQEREAGQQVRAGRTPPARPASPRRNRRPSGPRSRRAPADRPPVPAGENAGRSDATPVTANPAPGGLGVPDDDRAPTRRTTC